ncbi:MAG: hypothetical protein QF824_02755 [Candidatus Woesearchaeota archaeon]|jgi:hypothetical protein|nr:hypothetical protein [Candidatus Woesearchaeota archaeon]|tara:strand:+ start:93 stop:428 length:336 start_codon:yes stop_codon:yes gene_type:complete
MSLNEIFLSTYCCVEGVDDIEPLEETRARVEEFLGKQYGEPTRLESVNSKSYQDEDTTVFLLYSSPQEKKMGVLTVTIAPNEGKSPNLEEIAEQIIIASKNKLVKQRFSDC